MGDPHAWNSFPSYLDAHRGKLGDYADHFLIEDRLTYTPTTDQVLWVGELICRDGFEIHVRRLQIAELRHSGVLWVRTSLYSYHALWRTPRGTTTNLFRYDNIHPHANHTSPHHRHRFDRNGVEIKPVEHVGIDGWPNLGQVLDELHATWAALLPR